MTYTLGISCFYHDSAAALIKNDEIIGAMQEERYTRVKHDSSFPQNAIKDLLAINNLKLSDIDNVVFHEKPILKFERLIETYLMYAPKGIISFLKAMPIWLKEKLFQKRIIINNLKKIDVNFNKVKLKFSEHHLSHAASAFYPSPFLKSAVLVIDGVGEWTTTSVWLGDNRNLKKIKEINFPHSIGLLYSSFTYYLGFKVNSGEYKLMGLAPYGKPIYCNLIKEKLINVKTDGSFQLNMKYFDFATDLKMINKKFEQIFSLETKKPNQNFEQIHLDIAASIQKVTEELVINLCKNIKKELNTENLCLAGGVALNCVANGKILQKNIFRNLWIQPASGDAGCSLGAALANYNYEKGNRALRKEPVDKMKGALLGPSFKFSDIENTLNDLGSNFQKIKDSQIFDLVAKEISNGNSVGWFQGKMEFGPRALGNRSILADPRNKNMQKILNLKIKFRESFRPFAPIILEEKVSEFFKIKSKSPYMLLVAELLDKHKLNIKKNIYSDKTLDQINDVRSIIPAVTHVDYTARIQTVSKIDNPRLYKLLTKFYNITNIPLLINTSFNIRSEPIVCTVRDAYRCFMGTDLDLLVIENFVLYKKNQNTKLVHDYRNYFELD